MTKLFINENLTPRRKKLFSLAYKKKLTQNINFFGHTMVIYLSEKTPLVKESKSPANLILINFCKSLISQCNINMCLVVFFFF